MPVRKVSNRGKRNTIGSFPSIKMKRMIAYESLIERDYIYVLDFEQDVLEFEEQPLSIEYQHEGKQRHYTPDFSVKKVNHHIIVECKPKVFVDTAENRRKFDVARLWCEERGYQFQVVVESELREGLRLENIKLLTRFARQIVEPRIRASIYSALYSTEGGMTISNLAVQISSTNPSAAIPSILHMAFHHEIVLPLTDIKISGATPVSVLPLPV